MKGRCEIAIALKEIIDSNIQTSIIHHILDSVELSLNKTVFDSLDIKNIALYLHKIYCFPSVLIRTAVLEVCQKLEFLSPTAIIEKYGLDYLFARSIDCGPDDKGTYSARVDVEKAKSLKFVKMLIETKKYMPNSIIRALVSLHNSKLDEHKEYKAKCALYLLDISYFVTDQTVIPDIVGVLLDDMFEDNNMLDNILSLFSFAMEHQLPIVSNISAFVSQMLFNFSHYIHILIPTQTKTAGILYKSDSSSVANTGTNAVLSNTDQQKKIEETCDLLKRKKDSCVKAFIILLRSWPGFLCFGVENCGLFKLMSCLSHQSDAIVDILKGLIKINGSSLFSSVVDGYSGLLLSILLKLDLIDRLYSIAGTNSHVADFINDLLPFTSIHTSRNPSITGKLSNSKKRVDFSAEMYDVAREITCISREITCIYRDSTISFMQLTEKKEISDADWMKYQVLLNVVLPHSEADATLQAKNLYKKLAKFFFSDYINPSKLIKRTANQEIVETLRSFIDLLLNHNWGIDFLKDNQNFKSAVASAINKTKQNDIDLTSPHWQIFKCVMQMMVNDRGIDILLNCKDIQITELGNSISKVDLADAVLGEIRFNPTPKMAVSVFLNFLNNKNDQIHKIAIDHLKMHRLTTPDFHSSCFMSILMPHIKLLGFNNKIIYNNVRLKLALNLLGEIIMTDENELKTVAQDQELQKIILESSHLIFSLILSCDEARKSWGLPPYEIINNEIKYWIEKGNREYVDIFDRAVEATFNETLDKIKTDEPSIFNLNDYAPLPPHLFGQLSKTSHGFEQLSKSIPKLVEKLNAVNSDPNELRAVMFALAQFASIPKAINIIEQYNIAEKLITAAINSSSYIVKGTLISSLSLFASSHYLSTVLQKYNWQRFTIGKSYCLIPRDPTSLFKPVEPFQIKPPYLANPLTKNDYLVEAIKRLLNSQYFRTKKSEKPAIDAIEAIRTAKASKDKIDHNFALWVMKLISTFSFLPYIRVQIQNVLSDVPLMELSESDEPLIVTAREKAQINAKFFELANNSAYYLDFGLDDYNTFSNNLANNLNTPNSKSTMNIPTTNNINDDRMYNRPKSVKRSNKVKVFKFPMENNNEKRDAFSANITNLPIFESSDKDEGMQYEENSERVVKVTFDEIEVPLRSLTQLKGLNFDYPEVYLSEEEFQNTTGMSKDAFYEMSEGQMQIIRKNIVS